MLAEDGVLNMGSINAFIQDRWCMAKSVGDQSRRLSISNPHPRRFKPHPSRWQ